MSTLFTPPRFTPVDGNSQVMPGAKLYFYQTGTSTPLDTYSDSGLTSVNANPVVADANGLFGNIYLGTSSDYKVILKTSADVTVWTVDPYFSSSTSGRTAVTDASYTATITDRTIAYTTLTASRTITLPAASTFSAGVPLVIMDETGNSSGTVTLSVAPNGTDTINGVNATTVVVAVGYGSATLVSNGVSKWTVVYTVIENRLAVNDAAASANSRTAVVAYTAFTAARTVSLPSAATVRAGHVLWIIDESGSSSFSRTSGSTVGISVAPNGSDTIDGSNTTQLCVNIPRGSAAFVCDGSSKWIPLKFSVFITNTLGADVNLNDTANFIDGPSCAQGTVGRWWADGGVTVNDTSGGANIYCKLWDGTTVARSAAANVSAANNFEVVSLTGLIVSPAANIKISVKDATSTSGKILYNQTGASADASLTVRRLP